MGNSNKTVTVCSKVSYVAVGVGAITIITCRIRRDKTPRLSLVDSHVVICSYVPSVLTRMQPDIIAIYIGLHNQFITSDTVTFGQRNNDECLCLASTEEQTLFTTFSSILVNSTRRVCQFSSRSQHGDVRCSHRQWQLLMSPHGPHSSANT